jgi:CMP/dCMP kinase
MIIAIDGPAASGKGTIARRLARHYTMPHLDTGLLYRALAAAMMDTGNDLHDVDAALQLTLMLDPDHFDPDRLRGNAIGEAASVVAAYPKVRESLLGFQRQFASQKGGAVLDGRDIGTVIVPDAEIKIYVTASAEERARRRTLELHSKGEVIAYEEVLEDILRRDARDTTRVSAPLRRADDAYLLDTTFMDIETAVQAAIQVVEGRSKPLSKTL